MSENLIILPEADGEISEAYLWHERRSPGLGKEFVRCLDAAIAAIRRTPEAFSMRFETFRHYNVRRFPYTVYYEFEGGYVVVYAVFQANQDPDRMRRTLIVRKPHL